VTNDTLNYKDPILRLTPEELPSLLKQAEEQREDFVNRARARGWENLEAEADRVYSVFIGQIKRRIAKLSEAVAA
jgi:hypothetical protein